MKQHQFVAIIFMILLCLGLLTLIFMPKKTFSENENRFLAKMPELSLDNIFVNDRRFMKGFEEYCSDHFIEREFFIAAKTDIELLSGKKESNGVYIAKDQLLKKIVDPDSEVVDNNIEAIQEFVEETGIAGTFLLIPTVAGVYPELLPEHSDDLNQEEFMKDCGQKLQDHLAVVNPFATLVADKENYIYYRTDHHFTSRGAYGVYTDLIKAYGMNPVPLDEFTIEKVTDDFKGTLFSKTLYNGVEEDSIDFFHPKESTVSSVIHQSGDQQTEYTSLFFREFLTKKDKYAAFLGSNQPIVTIQTHVTEGEKILIFKDSYAHTMMQFLSLHFSEIVLVDLRYINQPIDEVLDLNRFDQVLFMYNVENFITDENISKLKFVDAKK